MPGKWPQFNRNNNLHFEFNNLHSGNQTYIGLSIKHSKKFRPLYLSAFSFFFFGWEVQWPSTISFVFGQDQIIQIKCCGLNCGLLRRRDTLNWSPEMGWLTDSTARSLRVKKLSQQRPNGWVTPTGCGAILAWPAPKYKNIKYQVYQAAVWAFSHGYQDYADVMDCDTADPLNWTISQYLGNAFASR